MADETNNTESTTSEQGATGGKRKDWLVMTTRNPETVLYFIDRENLRHQYKRLESNKKSIEAYSPFVGDSSLNKEFAEDKLSLRYALRRYVFIQLHGLTKSEFDDLLWEWNGSGDHHTMFLYPDKESKDKPSAISQHDLDRLKAMCGDDQVKIELPSSFDQIRENDEIPLSDTPFEYEGAKYKVIGARKKEGKVELQIELKMFGMTFPNMFVTYERGFDTKRYSALISSMQEKLLDILKRRITKKQSPVSKLEDKKTLQSIYEMRTLVIPDGTMKRHFLATMMLCAYMLGEKEQLKAVHLPRVMQELKAISSQGKSKSATSTRAFIHVALYLVTDNVEYRNLAKQYMAEHQPKNRLLHQFVTLIRKRDAPKLARSSKVTIKHL